MPSITALLCRIPGFLSRWVPGTVCGESSELIPKTTDLILEVYLMPLNRVSKGHLLIVGGAPIGCMWEIYFFLSLKTFNLETFSSITKCKNILKRMSSTLWLDSPTLNILHYLLYHSLCLFLTFFLSHLKLGYVPLYLQNNYVHQAFYHWKIRIYSYMATIWLWIWINFT